MNRGRIFWRLVQWQLAWLLHQRVAWVIGLTMLATLAASAALRGFNFGAAEPRFLQSVAVAAVLLAGTLLVALGGPALFFGGLETRSTELLLARGVGRTRLLAAQALAVLLVTGWLVVLGAIALTAVLAALGHGAAIGAALRALSASATSLLVLSGATIFACAIGRTALMASVLTLAVALAGHLASILAHVAMTSAGAERIAWRALGWLVPDFSALAAGGAVGLLLAAAYAAAFLGAASWIFARREL